LRKLGFTVDVFERTPEQLDHRGGGIVLQPITTKWFDGHSARAITELSTSSSRLRYLGPDNVVVHMSGALACTIGFERGEVSIDGGPPQPMTLRTTHVYRYTRAKWHLVHRHADFPPPDQRSD